MPAYAGWQYQLNSSGESLNNFFCRHAGATAMDGGSTGREAVSE